MEFALTPVPGVQSNIYQRTKLLTDPQYVKLLNQFDQRLKKGKLARKGRYIEGIFQECQHLKQTSFDNRHLMDKYGQFEALLDGSIKYPGKQYQFVDSQHIPYDEFHAEILRRSKLQQSQQMQQKLPPDLIQELDLDIDIACLKDQFKPMDHEMTQKQIKALKQLQTSENHQAYWVHNRMSDHEREKIQINSKNDLFAMPNSTLQHVQSYMLVQGKLIPSLKYKVKQKIYNRYKLSNSKNKSQELITFPQIDGPLRLPNIEQSHKTIDTGILLEKPVGVANLQTYIKTLQAKQQIIATKKVTLNQDEPDFFEDPREFEDLVKENKDLQEQMLCALKNLQSYLKVAQITHESEIEEFDDSQTFEGFSSYCNNAKLISGKKLSFIHSLDSETKYQTKVDFTSEVFADNKSDLSFQYETTKGYDSKKVQASQMLTPISGKKSIIDKIAEFNYKIKTLFFSKKQEDSIDQPKRCKTGEKPRRIRILRPKSSKEARLKNEITFMRNQLNEDFRNSIIIDLENRIRFNKQRVIELIKENIFGVRYGPYFGSEQLSQNDFQMALQSRERKIKSVKLLYKEAKARNLKLSEWGVHSEIISLTKLIRVFSDIVILCQEKNLLDEFYGIVGFKKVGLIEVELNYPLRISEKYGSIEDNEHFTKRMRIQFDEYMSCLNMVNIDIKNSDEVRNLMTKIISQSLGHSVWLQVVQNRWLRKQQLQQKMQFDPNPETILPVLESSRKYTQLAQKVIQQSTASKQIESQIPISGIDQFGSLDYFSLPQQVSRPTNGLIQKSARMNLHKRKKVYTKLVRQPIELKTSRMPEDYLSQLDQSHFFRRVPELFLSPIANREKQNEKDYMEEYSNFDSYVASQLNEYFSIKSDLNEQDQHIRNNMFTNFQLKEQLSQIQKERDEQLFLQQIKQDLEQVDGSTEDKPNKSKWITKINRELLAKKEREEQARKDRLKLKTMYDDSEDEAIIEGKVLKGDALFNYLLKVENVIKAEEKVLDSWRSNDQV